MANTLFQVPKKANWGTRFGKHAIPSTQNSKLGHSISPQIQHKMIEYFTNFDKYYGVSLAESLEKSSQMKDHTSSAAAEQTVKKAEKMGHEADPY
ncbi:hypothetical protein LIT25_08635 [Bacillus sp. F19]|nr:hypothetical protein LIT25_08635 [Bacillus sp. F19]